MATLYACPSIWVIDKSTLSYIWIVLVSSDLNFILTKISLYTVLILQHFLNNRVYDMNLLNWFVASVKLPPEKFVSSSQAPEEAPTEKKKIILNSSDELYGELRDKNFNAVGSLVSKKSKTITAEFDVGFLKLWTKYLHVQI